MAMTVRPSRLVRISSRHEGRKRTWKEGRSEAEGCRASKNGGEGSRRKNGRMSRTEMVRLGGLLQGISAILQGNKGARAKEGDLSVERKETVSVDLGADAFRKLLIPKTPTEFVWEVLGIFGTLGTGLWTGLILYERRRALEDLEGLRKIAEERLRQSEEQRHEMEAMQRTAEEQWRKSEARVRQLQSSLQELMEQGVVEAGAKMVQLQKELKESEASLLAATVRLNDKAKKGEKGHPDENTPSHFNDFQEKLVVPDTNCYLTDLGAVRRLKFTDAQVVVPTVVITELDGLQNSSESSTAYQARKALRYLSSVLAGGGNWLRGQEEKELRLMVQKTPDEAKQKGLPSLSYVPNKLRRKRQEVSKKWHHQTVSSPWYTSEEHEQPDNALIELSLFLAMKGSHVVLLTADKALQVKAMLYGVQSMPVGQFLRNTLENVDS
mmetsp:Transcript_4435/g.28272  ORF Transcript_4435/g.28272 Transcript_4435/m.28272 type:complete len:438 (+) Transcript_4435:42-1355(+)